jgi:hypothetical protein
VKEAERIPASLPVERSSTARTRGSRSEQTRFVSIPAMSLLPSGFLAPLAVGFETRFSAPPFIFALRVRRREIAAAREDGD